MKADPPVSCPLMPLKDPNSRLVWIGSFVGPNGQTDFSSSNNYTAGDYVRHNLVQGTW